MYPDQMRRDTFLMQNYINNTSLDFDDFIDFYEQRKTSLRNQLKTILNVSKINSEEE